ncbi:MAG: ABC transporter substrate-binding protein [Thermomicrobiales bacterium]
MSFESHQLRRQLLDRRALIAASITGGIGIASARVLAQPGQSTPVPPGTPVASPVSSPVASPTPEPTQPLPQLPDASPASPLPLTVIRDQRPIETSAPVAGGRVRMHVQSANLDDFSPVSFRQDFQIACSLYDPLVWLDDVTCEPQPWLANSWSWTADGLELTLLIRDDVRWHDGTPLTAADIAFSLTVYQEDYASAVSGFFSLVTTIASTDERSVVVTFAEPDGGFLFNAGNLLMFQSRQYGFAWSSRPLGERSLNGYDWSENFPVGTGPWQLQEQTETGLTLQRFDDYWSDAPHLDHLILMAEDDLETQLDMWKQDELDIVWPIPPADTNDLVSEEGRLYAADSLRSMFAAYNFENPARLTPSLMSSLELRQALLLAMDRERYQRSIFGSFIDTTQAGSISQPWARDERIANPVRNVDVANQLLDSLGWVDRDLDGIRETPEGDALALVAIVQNDAPAELITILQSLDSDFRDIGVSLIVDILDPTAWAERWVVTRDYDLIAYSLLGYGAFNEFDLYGSAWDIRSNQAGWNPGGYANDIVDAALAEWFGAFEIDDMRLALYKLQRAVTDDPFGLFFGFPQDPILVRPGLLGYQPNKMWQGWNTRLLWKPTSE